MSPLLLLAALSSRGLPAQRNNMGRQRVLEATQALEEESLVTPDGIPYDELARAPPTAQGGLLIKEGYAPLGKFPVNKWGKVIVPLNSTSRVGRVRGQVIVDHTPSYNRHWAAGKNTYIWSEDLSVELSSPWNHECSLRNIQRGTGRFQNESLIHFEFDNFRDTSGRYDRASGLWNLTLTDRGNEYVGDIVYFRFEFVLMCVPPDEPPAPKLMSVTNSSISLLWSLCGDTGGCNITAVHIAQSFRGSDSCCDPEQPDMPSGFVIVHIANPAKRMYTRTGLKPGTKYAYRVRVVSTAGWSDWSDEMEAVTRPGTPLTPTSVGAKDYSANAVHLTWDEPPGNGADISYYEVQMQPAEESDVWVDMGNTSELLLSIENLQPETKYRFRVRAFNIAGASHWTAPVALSTIQPPPETPSPPTISSRTPHSLQLLWAPGNDNGNPITGYKLEQSQDSYGPFSLVYQGSEPYTSVEGLMADTTYWYKVSAENVMGISGCAGPASFETLKEGSRSEQLDD